MFAFFITLFLAFFKLTSAHQIVLPAYGSTPIGSCGFPVDFDNPHIPLVALGPHEFGPAEFKSHVCGQCVQINGPSGIPVIAQVASKCLDPACYNPGTIQLSHVAVRQLDPNGISLVPHRLGGIIAHYHFVPCPAGTHGLYGGSHQTSHLNSHIINPVNGLPVAPVGQLTVNPHI